MIRLVVFVAGVVVGALGTLVVQHPQQVAEKVREAAAWVRRKIREAHPTEEPQGERPVDPPGEMAA